MTQPTEQQLKDPAWWDENAPEGATHYFFKGGDRTAGFYKSVGSSALFWGFDGWSDHCSNPFLTDRSCIPRPAKLAEPEWNGEGYPPVGCECEFRTNDSDWLTVSVRYISKFGTVVDVGQGIDAILPEDRGLHFRPLRTKEQRDRDELIEAIKSDLDVLKISNAEHTASCLAIGMINRGWRKGGE